MRLRDQKEQFMIQPNGLCGLARVTGGTCTRTGLGMMVFMVMQENVFYFSEKHICVFGGKHHVFKIFHLKNGLMENVNYYI